MRDAALLWRLGEIGRLAGIPFLAAASPGSSAATTSRQRPTRTTGVLPQPSRAGPTSAKAPRPLISVWPSPRVMLRAPYGLESNSIETFPFAEFAEPPAHDSYLWGNPAFAVALLVGPSFDSAGHFESTCLDPSLTDLPLAIERSDDGDTQVKPCAEVLLGRRAVDRITEAGLMPLQSVRDQGIVRLANLVSIAASTAPLHFR